MIQKDGKSYRRTPEVLDCWFESGAMPYAQRHHPFEGAEHFAEDFPAQFIAEGLDQTRVQHTPPLQQQTVVGHLVRQGMLEGVFLLGEETRLIQELRRLEVS